MSSLLIVLPAGPTTNKRRIRSSNRRRCTGVLPTSVSFRHWALGFRQFSFSHIAQVLQVHSLHGFNCFPLHDMLLSPFLFRSRLVRSPRSVYPELRPSAMVIPLCVTRRTLSIHQALTSTISAMYLQ